MLLIGVLVLCGTAFWSYQQFEFIARAVRVKGAVSALNAGGSHPQIKFATSDGILIEFAQGGLIFGYAVGDPVEVIYDAKNPSNASINTFLALWGFASTAFAAGVFMVTKALLSS